MTSGTAAEEAAERAVERRFMTAERLVFFSDAVVAIAMTLLALELPVPTGATNQEFLRSSPKTSRSTWRFSSASR